VIMLSQHAGFLLRVNELHKNISDGNFFREKRQWIKPISSICANR
jgi:hypothetical protein